MAPEANKSEDFCRQAINLCAILLSVPSMWVLLHWSMGRTHHDWTFLHKFLKILTVGSALPLACGFLGEEMCVQTLTQLQRNKQ